MLGLLTPWLKRLEQYPDAVAVEDPFESVSGAELLARAMGVANALRTLPVRRGSNPVVVVKGTNTVQAIISYLGILCSDQAFSFIQSDAPSAAFEAMIATLSPSSIIYTREARDVRGRRETDRLPPDLPVIVATQGIEDATWNPGVIKELAIAYVLFSSGSTGIPKGVCVSSRASVHAVNSYIRDLAISAGDVIANTVSFSFDISIFDIFASLWTGAKLVLPALPQQPSLQEVADSAVESGASVVFTVPSIGIRMLSHLGSVKPPRLRALALTGERTTAKFMDEFQRFRPKGLTVWDLYGGTEMPYVLARKLDLDNPEEFSTFVWSERDVALGIDGDFNVGPAYVGHRGELCVRGVSVMSGYLRSPTDWPQSVSPQASHATGDVVEILRSDRITLIGRKDRQVRLFGYRIELDVIDAWIERHPAVEAALSLLDETNKQIVSLVQGKDSELTLEDFYSHCREGLMSYMTPSRIVNTMIPRTRTGKKDFRAGREMIAAASQNHPVTRLNGPQGEADC